MVKQDYIARMIHDAVRTVLRLSFHIDIKEEIESINFYNTHSKDKYDNLTRLVDEGKINEAEDFLFEMIDKDNKGDLEVGILFYEHLNNLTDERLEEAGFSREEVRDGLAQVMDMYGYAGFV